MDNYQILGRQKTFSHRLLSMRNPTYVLLLFVACLCVEATKAQSSFQRLYPEFIGRTEQVLLPNEDLVLAGTRYSSGKGGIPVARLNPCGSTLWSVLLEDPSKTMELIDMKMDGNQNLFLAGNYFMRSGERNIFLAKLDLNGRLDFFKVFNSGTSDILYSMDISVNEEVYLYFKTNIGQSGPQSVNTVASFNQTGSLIWLKTYGFTAVWGQLSTTAEGGFIITNNRLVQKFNRQGVSQWSKEFNRPMYAQDHLQVGNQIYIFRYPNASSGNSALASVDLNGNLNWHSPLIPNFRPYRGIERANGNLLYLGSYSSTFPTFGPLFIEFDRSNGNILDAVLHRESIPNIRPHDLNELADSTIIYSGFEIKNTIGNTMLSRIDKELGRANCLDTNLSFTPLRDSALLFNASPWNASPDTIPLIDVAVNTNPFNFGNSQLSCEFRYVQNLDLGDDTTLCPGEIWRDTVANNFEGFSWTGATNERTISISRAGTYILNAWKKCDTISDTLRLNYYPLKSLTLGPDTSICKGDTIVLQTNNGELAVWNTGDTASRIRVANSGKYYASQSTFCGVISDTVNLTHIPKLKLDLGEDTLVCKGERLFLSADPNASQILWSTGSNSNQIAVDQPGLYWVDISNQCEILSDSLRMSWHPYSITEFEIDESGAEVYDSVFFRLFRPKNFQSLSWSFGNGNVGNAREEMHIYPLSGNYQVSLKLTDSLGCAIDSSFTIEIRESDVIIPNVFTPNGDGINDQFKLRIKGLDRINLKVFNRWGKLVYEGSENYWSGKDQGGRNLQAGTYFFTMIYQQIGREEKKFQGTVSILE